MAKRKKQQVQNLNTDIQKTVLDILNSVDNVDPKDISKVTVEKFDKILSLISANIKMSAGNRNFDQNEFRIDKSTVFNYKMKYSTTGNISKDDIQSLNLFYQKHKNLTKILLAI
mgnify:CR=1 FL=1